MYQVLLLLIRVEIKIAQRIIIKELNSSAHYLNKAIISYDLYNHVSSVYSKAVHNFITKIKLILFFHLKVLISLK